MKVWKFNYDRLNALMTMKRLTANGLATRLGVSKQIVHKWVAGEAIPMLSHLLLLCDWFKVRPDYFFHQVDAKKAA